MKKLLILVFMFYLCICGCNNTQVPEESIKKCLEKGWKPYYYSSIIATKFKCSKDEENFEENSVKDIKKL